MILFLPLQPYNAVYKHWSSVWNNAQFGMKNAMLELISFYPKL